MKENNIKLHIKETSNLKEVVLDNNDVIDITISEVDSACKTLCKVYADVLEELAK